MSPNEGNTDKSILLQMEEEGREAPRVKLKGTERSETATSRYDVIGEIARGGVGVVHRGRDNDLGRDVALKVLHDEHLENPELVQRFVEEAQIGGQLQHPGIVPVYELGLQSDKRPFFAMKLVKGETLAQRIAKRADASADRRALLAIFREVCRTMAYAHARGVIHRDLKPSNVMIGGFGEVQVVDWGFAKVMRKGGVADETLARKAERDRTMISTVRSGEGSSASIAGSVMGTPAYMSPEQAMGRVDELDEKSDLFSLGGVLCEILTGRPPYEGSDKDRMTAAAQARLDPALARLDACGADARLITLCKHCLEPLPKDRPANANAVADTVAAYLANAEGRAHRARVRALKAKTRAEAQRKGRRQTLLVGAGVLATLLIGLGAYLWIDAGQRGRAKERQAAIETALQDAERLRAAGDWPAALAAAERAIELGHEGALVAEIRAQAKEATDLADREREDDAFLAELERIRGRYGQGSVVMGARRVLGHREVNKAIDVAYVAAFEKRFRSIDGSLQRLKASRHARAFAANLGFWTWLRRTHPVLKDKDWKTPDRLARALDPGNDNVRDAVNAGDAEALLEIARKEDDRLPPALAGQVGLALTMAGHAEDAVVFLREYQRRHPDDFEINTDLGHAAEKLEDFELVLRHATAALALRPEHAGAWRAYGTALMNQGDADGAVAALRRSTELDPTDGRAWNNLGGARAGAGDLDGAVAAYLESVRLMPQDAYAYTNLGHVYLLQRKYDEALAIQREAVQRAPKWPAAHLNLGAALFHHGEIDKAILAYRRAVQLDEQYVAGLHALGQALLKKGELLEAESVLRQALDIDPDHALSHLELGVVLSRQGKPVEATAAYRKAIELDPTNPDAHANLALQLWRFKRDLVGAEREFRAALELNAEARVHVQFGTMLSNELRRYDDAIYHFQEALRLDPKNRYARNNLGVTFSRRGELEKAIEAFRDAVQFDPQHKNAQASLTRAEEALALRKRLPDVLADKDRPADASEAVALAGMALRLRKDFAGALRLYREAFERDPEVAADPRNGYRYDAACAAVLAGKENYAQALTWLRADLEAWEAFIGTEPRRVGRAMDWGLKDADLAPVRDVDDLPDDFKKFWADVDALLKRAKEASK